MYLCMCNPLHLRVTGRLLMLSNVAGGLDWWLWCSIEYNKSEVDVSIFEALGFVMDEISHFIFFSLELTSFFSI